MQRDTTGLTAENKELKLRLQAMEQQAQLREEKPLSFQSVSSSKKTEKDGKNKRPVGHSSTMDYLSSSTPYDYSRNYDTITRLPNSSISYDSFADATSEKESGNEYFKQKKFKEAIDCYLELEALHYLKQQ
ncbi:hypothetical protein CsatB_024323 [Cannabis sativa]